MLTECFTIALNHLLRSQPRVRERLAPHAGSILRLAMPPWRATWVVNPDGSLAQAAAGTVDIDVNLPAWAPLAVLGATGSAFDAARISGSAPLADALAFVVRNLRWDYEEDLSRVVGDIPARRIARLVEGLARRSKQAAGNLGENVAEYLRDEIAVLVPAGALAQFGDSIGALRADLDRLEGRLSRLEAATK